MQETDLDRIIRRFRVPLMALAVLSAPVTLFSYAWGLKLVLAEVGYLWGGLIGICNVTALVGFGCLVDSRQEQQTRQEPDR